jgi:hypothetical protein
MENDQQLASLHEIAERFGLPPAWVKSEADQGRLPVLRVGRRRLFSPAAVERALLERASNTPSDSKGADHA